MTEFDFRPYLTPDLDNMEDLVVARRSAAPEICRRYAEEMQRSYAAPVDLARGLDYLTHTLPPGKYLLYGAGVFGKMVMDVYRGSKDVEIVGFLNQTSLVTSIEGLPIHPPEYAAQTDLPIILTANNWERQFRRHLEAQGVTPERIVSVFTSDGYAQASAEQVRALVDATPKANQVDTVVVGESVVCWLLSTKILGKLFDPARTVHLVADRGLFKDKDPVFPVYFYDRSYGVLIEQIRRIQPKTVYLYLGEERNAVANLFHHFFPEIQIIEEWYDVGGLTSPGYLTSSRGFDPIDLDEMLAAETLSAKRSSLVLSKRDIHEQARLYQGDIERFAMIFPDLDDTPCPPPPPPSEKIRIAYYGPLPSRFSNSKDYLHETRLTFEALAADPRIELTLVSRLHFSDAHNDGYRCYQEGVFKNAIYHRRLSLDQLFEVLSTADYAWIAVPRPVRMSKEEGFIFNNKFGTAISACVPVIVDDNFESMAKLVRTHSAGIVLDHRDMSNIANQIVSLANRPLHRQGTEKLRNLAQENNRETFRRIRQLAT